MAKQFQSCAPTRHALIIRDAAGERIGGTSSRGDIDYSRRMARDILLFPAVKLADGSEWRPASVDIYRHSPEVSWRELEPLCTVTLDDEEKAS